MPIDIKKLHQDINPRGTRGRHFDRAVAALAPAINELRSAGVRNIGQLANCLNDKGFVAPSGGKFTYGTTRRVLTRLRELHLGQGPRSLSQAASQRPPRPYTPRKTIDWALVLQKLKATLDQHENE